MLLGDVLRIIYQIRIGMVEEYLDILKEPIDAHRTQENPRHRAALRKIVHVCHGCQKCVTPRPESALLRAVLSLPHI